MVADVTRVMSNVLVHGAELGIRMMEKDMLSELEELSDEECEEIANFPGEVAFRLYRKRAYKLGYRGDLRKRWDTESPDIVKKYRRLAWRVIGIRQILFGEKPDWLKNDDMLQR